MMISEAPQTTPSITSHLSRIPSRFLKPTIFLSSKQSSTKPIFHDIKTPDQSNYFKKYFGGKVTCAKRYTQLSSAYHSQKSFQKISFDKDICKKDGFKSFQDMVILANDIPTPKGFSKKVLKGFRGKLSLAFKPKISNIARYIKNNLNHVQSLELTLDKIKQFGFHRRTFDGLESLQSFSLRFDPEFEKECGRDLGVKALKFDSDSSQQNSLAFIFLLLQKTHLKRLKINLAPYPISSVALSYLLLFIEQANIPEWYVKSGMMPRALNEFTSGKDVQSNPKFPLHLTNSSEVIQKIDFFGLYVVNEILVNYDEEWYSDDCCSMEFSPPLLSKIPQLTSKSRKVLDITLTEKVKKKLTLTTLLEKFSSLEGLYIKSPENALTFSQKPNRPQRDNFNQMRNFNQRQDSEDDMNPEEEPDYEMNSRKKPKDPEEGPEEEAKSEKGPENPPQKDFCWMKNLKHALLSIVDAEYEDYRSRKSGKPFEGLMKHLRDHCTTLESLNVFYASTTYKGECGVTSRIENAVKIPCKSLVGLNSLQELEINSDENGLTGVTKTLRSLKNLKKLRLNFCDNVKPFTLGEKGSRFDDQVEDIFDGLEQLREFELYIRPDQSDTGPNPLHWVRYFARNIRKLKDLEVLKVFDSKEASIEMDVFLLLLKVLGQFTSLREIVLHSKIVINAEALELAADLYEDTSDTVEDRVIGFLQSKVNRIIHMNPKLRLIDIRCFKDMKIDYVLYKAKE